MRLMSHRRSRRRSFATGRDRSAIAWLGWSILRRTEALDPGSYREWSAGLARNGEVETSGQFLKALTSPHRLHLALLVSPDGDSTIQ